MVRWALLTLVSQTFQFPVSSHLSENIVIKTRSLFSGRVHILIQVSPMTSQKEGRKFYTAQLPLLHPRRTHSSLVDGHRQPSMLFSSLLGYRRRSFHFVLLETEPTVSHMLGRHSTADGHTQLNLLWKWGTTFLYLMERERCSPLSSDQDCRWWGSCQAPPWPGLTLISTQNYHHITRILFFDKHDCLSSLDSIYQPC